MAALFCSGDQQEAVVGATLVLAQTSYKALQWHSMF